MPITLRIRRPTFRRFHKECRRWTIPSLMFLAALPVYAQTGASPWENAVNALRTSFTGPIAQGLSLVAIVVGGLMFAYGEGQYALVAWMGYRVVIYAKTVNANGFRILF